MGGEWHNQVRVQRALARQGPGVQGAPRCFTRTIVRPISTLADRLYPRKEGPGQPPKVGMKEAAFLAVIREHHHQMPYRELASSRYVRWLGIAGVHYTAIQKAIGRLPKRLLDEAIGTLAEFVSSEEMDAVADATCFRAQKVRD